MRYLEGLASLVYTTLLPGGRVPRWRFWFIHVVSYSALFFLMPAEFFTLVVGVGDREAAAAAVSSLSIREGGILIAFAYVSWVATANRLHDRNRSSLWVVLAIALPLFGVVLALAPLYLAKANFLPGLTALMLSPTGVVVLLVATFGSYGVSILLGLWLLFECAFLEGTPWDNLYGPPPGGYH